MHRDPILPESLAPEAGAGPVTEPPHAVSQLPSRSQTAPLSVLMVGAGSGLQAYFNDTLHAVLLAITFLFLGAAIVGALFRRAALEERAFLLSYSVCILGGGLAQWYATAMTGQPHSFIDAIMFYDAIFPDPPYYSWDELQNLWADGIEVGRGAPLAIAIWQAVYHLRLLLGLDYGIYVGVMFNALCMGITAAITVRTARELFGDEAWRLRLVGTLFALCGLFILFGSVLIRDCFTTLVNAIVLFGIVRWLRTPTSRNLTLALVLTAVCVLAMMYLRSRTVVMFGAFWVLAGMCWFSLHRIDLKRMLAIMLALVVLAAGSAYFADYIGKALELQAHHMDQYEGLLEDSLRDDSLAMRLVVQQPLPVRLVLGTGSMMVFPIPFWDYWTRLRTEYHVIKGYQALFQLLIMPSVIAGFVLTIMKLKDDRRLALPFLFLGVYLAMNIMAVVATSLEQRHVAQFMPALIILAVIPNARIPFDRKILHQAGIVWFGLVFSVHVAWAVASMGR